MHTYRQTTNVRPASELYALCANDTEALGLGPRPDEQIERVQLERLAEAVLSKSPDDLAALSLCNPDLIVEWIAAFDKEQRAAEAAGRRWAAARAALKTAPGARPVAEAAE